MNVCFSCGEKTDFRDTGRQYGSCNFSERCEFRIDQYGDIEDTLDTWDEEHDNHDYGDTETDGDIKCGNCESGNVIDIEEEDWEQWEEDVCVEEQVGFDEDSNCFTGEKTQEKGKLNELKTKIMGGQNAV
tara:strand:+ start:3268 stop:3657 length:390 start_codon:yes stop_codon:yes gene_type:complete